MHAGKGRHRLGRREEVMDRPLLVKLVRKEKKNKKN